MINLSLSKDVLHVSHAIPAIVRDSVQKGREYQLHIGSFLVETCDIIYVFYFPLY